MNSVSSKEVSRGEGQEENSKGKRDGEKAVLLLRALQENRTEPIGSVCIHWFECEVTLQSDGSKHLVPSWELVQEFVEFVGSGFASGWGWTLEPPV